jgi:hypothetical protein
MIGEPSPSDQVASKLQELRARVEELERVCDFDAAVM